MEMVMRRAVFIIAVTSAAFLAPARAQDNAEEDALPNEAAAYAWFMPATSSKQASGRVEMTQFETEYSREFKLFGQLPVAVSLCSGYIGLNNSTPVRLPAQLAAVNADIEVTLPFFTVKKTYFRCGVTPTFVADSWNFSGSDFRLPFRTYLVYEASKKLIFVGGVAIYPDYEDDVSPVVGVIYMPDDKWVFNLTTDNPSISYAFNDKFTLFLEGDIDTEEFEISRDVAVRRVLRYSGSYAGSGIGYELNKYASISLSAGGIFNRSLRYRDPVHGKVSLKNSFYTQFNLEAAF
jgi:hypothetical protein